MWVSANSDMARFLRSRFDNLWDHGEDLARHMFCEVRLPGLEAPLIDDMKFVETAGHVYLCFGDRTERDRAYAEEHVVVLLPDPLQRVPVQYGIAPVGRDVARSIEDAFTVKYPHDACPWGIGELLPVHRA
jgi:hypothetical protein